MAVLSAATTNLTMLTPEELIAYKKKPSVHVFSLGQKESDTVFDPEVLNMKLANMEQMLSVQRVRMVGQLSKGVWRPDVNKAEITHKTGPCWDTLGHSVDSKLFVHPEEALYLVDTSALELTYNDVTLSLQRSYHLLLHETGVSLDFYRVYAYLSLLGYKVMRHSVKNVLTKYEKDLEIHKLGIKHRNVKDEFLPTSCGNYDMGCEQNLEGSPTDAGEKSEREILARLRENGPRKFICQISNLSRSPDFDVFQPDTAKFRKSTVQLPNFRISVCNSSEPVPKFNEVGGNQNEFSDKVPFIFAVVYPDFINFLQIQTVSLPVVI